MSEELKVSDQIDPPSIEHTPSFRKELESLINIHSMENGSDTPDFILAEFLSGCLRTFDAAVTRRAEWYGHTKPRQEETDASPEAPEDK